MFSTEPLAIPLSPLVVQQVRHFGGDFPDNRPQLERRPRGMTSRAARSSVGLVSDFAEGILAVWPGIVLDNLHDHAEPVEDLDPR